ncbi:MAG: cupin domain-containing protein [bacterium]
MDENLETLSSNWIRGKNKLIGEKAVIDTVSGNNMSVARYTMHEKMNVAKHSHGYEQIVYVLKGKMILTIEDKDFTMKSGDIQVILSEQEHSASIVDVPYQCIEFYSPKRNDMQLNK